MRIGLIPLAMLTLCGCDSQDPATIPLDQSNGFRDGYLANVTRGGIVEWNGQKLDDAQFKTYLQQFAALPKGAGRLWVEFEPGVSATRTDKVRQQIIMSGLCKQRRCVEGVWGMKRPVVN